MPASVAFMPDRIKILLIPYIILFIVNTGKCWRVMAAG